MILVTKEKNVVLKTCSQREMYKLNKSDIILNSSMFIELEEGFTLRNYFEFIEKYKLTFHPRMKEILEYVNNSEDLETDDEYDYISVIPEYDVVVNNNMIRVIKQQMIYSELQLSNYEDTSPLFPNMFGNNLILDLPMYIEGKTVNFSNYKFILPSQITMNDFIYCICDSIVDF